MAETGKKRPTYPGKCAFCGASFSKGTITRHLGVCPKRKDLSQTGPSKLYHLAIDADSMPEYWIHVQAPADAMLRDLDEFLRALWLECCGHLSAFTIGPTSYVSRLEEEEEETDEGEEFEEPFDALFEAESEAPAAAGEEREAVDPWGGDDRSMDIALGEVLKAGLEFHHEYDFGTTTSLRLRVLSERQGLRPVPPVRLLARNEPPEIVCESCGKAKAAMVCPVCMVEGGKAFFCRRCSGKHECEEDELYLPVLNSPRMGVCGYEG